MHRASVMTPPDAAPAAEPVPVPPAAPPPRPARAARTTRLTQTVAREGDDALAHLERAHAALRDGHVDEAVSAATAAVAASNGSVEARIVLSRAQLKAGHVDDALETVSQALERDALNPALYLLLGACAASRGDLADAVAGWERYQRLAPDAPDTSHVRAVADAAARLRNAMKELGDV
jgi:tetratricopeptide (TPR) repeat protein